MGGRGRAYIWKSRCSRCLHVHHALCSGQLFGSEMSQMYADSKQQTGRMGFRVFIHHIHAKIKQIYF